MTPRIHSGDLVEVVPLPTDPKVGDVVLCSIGGNDYLHLVKSITADRRFTIGNNHGRINGTIARDCIFGVLSAVSK